jgi:hypothetical protein
VPAGTSRPVRRARARPGRLARRHTGYLSFGYEDEATEAERRGWVVARMDGLHLHPVVAPADVADALQILVAALDVRL